MKCVDCGEKIKDQRVPLCDECYKERLKKAILSDEEVSKRYFWF